MAIDPSTTKYLIQARLEAEGVVDKPDVVGAVFGQTEGLLGEELDLRDLQKSGRIGRIEVEVQSKRGRSDGTILIPSSLDQVETSILAAALETIDRIGPCKAGIRVDKVEDVRVTKRNKIIERARTLLAQMVESSKTTGTDLLDEVRGSVSSSEIVTFGPERLPAGPNVNDSDAIIVVEGRNDVITLLRAGIKNAIAAEGTNVPKTIQELSKERVLTAFVDGDRGGDLVLRELLQVAEVDFVARAPRGREVEELTSKQITKALRNKISGEQYIEMFGLSGQAYKPSEEGAYAAGDDEGKPVPSPALEATPAQPQTAAAPLVAARPSSPRLEKYKPMLYQMGGSSKARLLDEQDNVVAEVPVRELVDTLKQTPQAKTVVFDGIVTQRILDIAAEQGMHAVVGTKMGSITNAPEGLEVWTRTDIP